MEYTSSADFTRFSMVRLERMKDALIIALESPCSNAQFLEWCNRYDCIEEELSNRINSINQSATKK